MAHALGLSITLLSWAHCSDEEQARLRAILQIPRAYGIVVNAAVGYPEHSMEPPMRKAENSTLFIK